MRLSADVEHLQPRDTSTSVFRVASVSELILDHESPGTEFKYPSDAQNDFRVDLIRTHLLESLLNARETPKRLLFGVEDRTTARVGCFLGIDPDFGAIASRLMTGLDSAIFPTLRPEWFEIVFYESSTQPCYWREDYFEMSDWPLKTLPVALAITYPGVAFYPNANDEDSGRLVISKSTKDKLNDFDPTKHKFGSFSQAEVKTAWKSLRRASWIPVTSDLGNAAPLYVIEIRLKNETYSGSFFRTIASPESLRSATKLRLCFPYWPQSPTKPMDSHCSLDPLAVWLRVQSRFSFDHRIKGIFSSNLFLKIFIGEVIDFDNLEFSCRYYLQNHDAVQNTLRLPLVSLLPPARQFNYTSRFHRIIIAKLDHADYIFAAANASLVTDWNVLLLVDPRMPHCREKLNQHLSKIGQNRVIAVKALLLPQETTFAAIPFALRVQDIAKLPSVYSHQEQLLNQVEHITFDPPTEGTLDLISEHSLKQSFRDWLIDSGTRAPPWELFQSNYIFCTRPAQTLYDALQHHWRENAVLQRIVLTKVFPASGASSLLRTVAYKEHIQDTLVLWVHSIRKLSKATDIAQVLQTAFGRSTTDRVLVCTDELGLKKREKLSEALQHAMSTRDISNPIKIIWLDLRASTLDQWSSSSSKSSVVSPFVDAKDADGLACCLSQAFSENKEALQRVARLAKYSSEPQDSHMLAFALAASQGMSKSITCWVAEIHDDLRRREGALYRVALAFAFASAFAPSRATKHRCISDGPIQSVSPDAPFDPVFRKLFPRDPVPPTFETTSCLHPFLARLFLSRAYDLHWNHPYLDWPQLCAAWNSCVQVFKFHEKCHSTLQSLISDGNNTIFTPFIIECWSSLTKSSLDETLAQISDLVLKAIPPHILSFHSHILESRLARCAAQHARKAVACSKYMRLAITHAREALKESEACGANQGDLFMVKQNLAIMLGVAHDEDFTNEAKEANEILRALYNSAQPHDQADIVAMGVKWTGPYSDEWKDQTGDSPMRSSQRRPRAPITAPPTSSTSSTIAPLEVQFTGWKFDPSLSRFWIFAVRQSKIL